MYKLKTSDYSCSSIDDMDNVSRIIEKWYCNALQGAGKCYLLSGNFGVDSEKHSLPEPEKLHMD
jgi:hypothetical protein